MGGLWVCNLGGLAGSGRCVVSWAKEATSAEMMFSGRLDTDLA